MPLFGTRGAASVTGFGGLAKLGYLLRNSLRFRASNSAYLSRTPSVTGNRKVWTWSGWVKRGQLDAGADDLILFSSPSQSGNDGIAAIYFDSGQLHTYYDTSGANPYGPVGPALYRDPAAWYHIVWAVDAANTIHYVYVNNTLVSTDAAYYPPNYEYSMNRSGGYTHTMGTQAWGATNYFDGYMTEINFVDGQALTPSSFGKTDPATGQWIPIKYSGTYGTNGFYLNFTDASAATAAAIGKDSSGNGNNWTPNNISVTAGATYDSMTDVPTLTSATAANYCVLNPLSPTPYGSLSNGNLLFTNAGVDWGGSKSTFAIPTTGKWYAEFTIGSTSSNSAQVDMGIFPSSNPNGSDWTGSYGLEANNGFFLYTNGSSSSNRGSTTAGGTVFQIAVDSDAGKVWFGVANSWYDTYNTTNGNPSAGTNPSGSGINFSTTTYFMGVKTYLNNWTANFGQRPFSYTAPSGFKSLNAFNLP